MKAVDFLKEVSGFRLFGTNQLLGPSSAPDHAIISSIGILTHLTQSI